MVVGQLAQRGDWAAYSEACSGPTLVYVVHGPLLPVFHDFHGRISFCCHGVLFPIRFMFPFMHNMWRQTHIQKK
jgi:hypothetical protein